MGNSCGHAEYSMNTIRKIRVVNHVYDNILHDPALFKVLIYDLVCCTQYYHGMNMPSACPSEY